MHFRLSLALAAFALANIDALPARAETLAELARHTHYHGIAFARSGTAVLLLASHHGLFALDKDGTATRVSPVQDFMGFSPDPAQPTSYYASGHPAEGGNSGFLHSADGGATWKQLSPGVDGPVDFHQMDVSPLDPKTIYGSYGRIQVSRDGGSTWTIAGNPPADLIALAASSQKTERIYAATRNGLHVSQDGGASWAVLGFTGEVVSTVKAGPGNALYAFVLGKGLMRTTEGSAGEWQSLANDFGETIPLHLAIDGRNDRHLALTTQTNAVLESHDGGKSWRAFGKSGD